MVRASLNAFALVGLLLTAANLPAAEPPVRIEELDGKGNGFKVVLARASAEKLRDTLNKDVDENKIAELLKELSKDARSKIVIVLVATNVTKFKKELNDKMGKVGVAITVTGPKFADKDANPALGALDDLKGLLPPELRGLPAMFNTNPKLALISPWFWKLTPRDE